MYISMKYLKALLASKFFCGMVSGILLVALPLYILELGNSVEEAGHIFGFAMFFYGTLSFYVGSRSENWGRRVVGIFAIISMGLSILLFGLLAIIPPFLAIGIFVLGKICLNLGESVLLMISKVRILDISKKNSFGFSYGLLLLADCGGYALGMLFAAFLLKFTNVFSLFFGLPLLMILAGIFFYYSGDSKRIRTPSHFSVRKIIDTPRSYKIILLLYSMLMFEVIAVDYVAMPLFQSEVLLLETDEIFLSMGIAWIIYAIASPFGGLLYDRFGKFLLPLGLFGIAIASLMLAGTREFWPFTLLLTVNYLFYALADPCRNALMGQVCMKDKGMLASFFDLCTLWGAAILLFSLGKIIELWGFASLFYIRALVQIVGIALACYSFYLLKKETQAYKHRRGHNIHQ